MKRLLRRVIGGLCIITALLLTQVPARLTQAATTAKEDFLLDNQTLVKYTGTATTVSVSDDIKIIGEEAFANNPYIGIISLGKNVKKIDHGAFANCAYLNRVVIPDSVTEIDSAAFSGCTNLKTVSIGNNVESFGDGVFAACKNLRGISIARGNRKLSFEAGVLYDNNKEHIYTYLSANPYEIYYMPNSVSGISPYSFWGNEDLEEVYLSSSLEEIPAYSFSNCKDLVVVQIPYSVDSIDAKAFENCISLKDVEIPASVKYIDPTAFDGCSNLNIIADEGTAAYEFFRNFDRSDVYTVESEDTKTIIENVNDNNSSSKDTDTSYNSAGYIDASKDPSNVEWMPSVNPLYSSEDSSVFGKTIIVNGSAVLFVDRELKLNELSQDLAYEPVSDENESFDNIVYDSGKGGYLPKYTYVNNNIAAQAFYASNNEEDYVIKDGTKKIGSFAFARSKAKSINIPEGVEYIGYGAFYHCDQLSDVTIPSTVKEIAAHAFDNTAYLNQYKTDVNQGPYLIVGDGILLACNSNSKNLIIPNGVKTISAGCFEDNSNIESVVLPDSLEIIDSDAFRNCINLEYVSGGANLSKINDRAFMGCPIKSFKIGANVKSIGLRAIDFSDSSLNDNQKVIVFEGNQIPTVSYDSVSSRLSNSEYRQDALYNVLFAVVDDSVDSFTSTVLDNNTLGFSGVIISKELSENGELTGNVKVKKNYIYSDELLNKLPDTVLIEGTEYTILDKDKITLAQNPYSVAPKSKEISIIANDSSIDGKASARFSQKESSGNMYINKSEEAKTALNDAYSKLFGGESIDALEAYDICVFDEKNIVKLDKLGKSSLYITVPVAYNVGKYHVISMDEDGQLEELPCFYNQDDKNLTFETTHLSYFGIYNTDSDNLVLNVKDGKVVKQYRLDASPDTGDNSVSIYYIISIALISVGLICILYRPKAA